MKVTKRTLVAFGLLILAFVGYMLYSSSRLNIVWQGAPGCKELYWNTSIKSAQLFSYAYLNPFGNVTAKAVSICDTLSRANPIQGIIP